MWTALVSGGLVVLALLASRGTQAAMVWVYGQLGLESAWSMGAWLVGRCVDFGAQHWWYWGAVLLVGLRPLWASRVRQSAARGIADSAIWGRSRCSARRSSSRGLPCRIGVECFGFICLASARVHVRRRAGASLC